MSWVVLKVNKVLPNQCRVLIAVTVIDMVRSLLLVDTSTAQIGACAAFTMLVLSRFLFCNDIK